MVYLPSKIYKNSSKRDSAYLKKTEDFQKFKNKAPRIPVEEIVAFLDENPHLKSLVDPFVEEGLKTMHL